MAGASLWATRFSGKLNGEMAATTPIGTRRVKASRPSPIWAASTGTISPVRRRASAAAKVNVLTARLASMRAVLIGLADSRAMVRAKSSARSASRRAAASRISARRHGGQRLLGERSRRGGRRARSTSPGRASAPGRPRRRRRATARRCVGHVQSYVGSSARGRRRVPNFRVRRRHDLMPDCSTSRAHQPAGGDQAGGAMRLLDAGGDAQAPVGGAGDEHARRVGGQGGLDGVDPAPGGRPRTAGNPGASGTRATPGPLLQVRGPWPARRGAGARARRRPAPWPGRRRRGPTRPAASPSRSTASAGHLVVDQVQAVMSRPSTRGTSMPRALERPGDRRGPVGQGGGDDRRMADGGQVAGGGRRHLLQEAGGDEGGTVTTTASASTSGPGCTRSG